MRELDLLAGSYFDLLWHFDPAAASAAGSISRDGVLGRFDAESMRAHLAAFRATAIAIEELDIEALSDEIDRTALLDDVRATIVRLEEDRPHVRDPGFWLGHLADAFGALLLRPGDSAADGARARAAAERVAAIPEFLDSARGVLSRPPVLLVDGALGRLGALGELLVAAAAVFGPAAPGGAEAFNVSVATALRSLAVFGHHLRSGIEPEPDVAAVLVGETRYDRRLNQGYVVRSSSAELWRYATELMAETERALIDAARALGATEDWREILGRLDEGSLDPVAGLSAEAARAESFLRERGLLVPTVTAPLITALPSPLGALWPPVRYVPGVERVFIASRRLSRFALPTLAAAEALPGRHLQESAARSAAGEVRRRIRTPVATEGWALYAEELMDDLGFAVAGETSVIRLTRLLQAGARLAADVGMHARGMTVAQAVAVFEHAGLGRAQSEAEVRHVVAHPTHGAAGAVGRRELRALRAAAGVRLHDPAALSAFHRRLLGYGALPPGLAGWGMGIER